MLFRSPHSVAADVLLSRPLELVKLAIQLGERPLRRRAFVEHRLKFERRCFESPEDHVAAVANALESRHRREAVKDRPGLGVEVALTPDDVGGLR